MAVASPRSLSRSPSLFPPFVSVSLPVFLPVYSPIVLIVLFVLPLALNPSHTTYVHVYTLIHTCAYTYIHTHTRAKCIPCFRSLCVPSFDPSSFSSSSSSCSFFPLVRSSHELRATTYVCPDLKIVRLVPGRSP